VRIVLGLLLLTAAGLKLSGLNVTALPRVGWFATPQVQVAAAEWELVLGIWLLSGAAQLGAWLAAVGTFLTFAAVSAYFGWIGVASCGCFGVIRTSPWTAFGVDLGALIALVLSRPNSRFAELSLSRRSAIIPLGAVAILFALTGIGTWVYGSPAAALAHLRGEFLTVEPSYADFGDGKPGDVVERIVTVYNWADQPVRLIGGTSDCSCVTTADLPLTIPPGEGRRVTIQTKTPTVETGAVTRAAQFWTDNDRQRTVRVMLGWRAVE
jgi:Methylamine utilisation protein MauE